ncbi:MAG: hypothetical protein AB1806_00085 [Acidobacteriota bacterium]
MRAALAIVLAVAAVVVGLILGLAVRQSPATGELTPAEAASALRASATFTMRAGSPVRREVVDIVAVRRIGQSSTEVEFTWRDSPPTGDGAPVRTSMALFRNRDGQRWVLTSLYKID